MLIIAAQPVITTPVATEDEEAFFVLSNTAKTTVFRRVTQRFLKIFHVSQPAGIPIQGEAAATVTAAIAMTGDKQFPSTEAQPECIKDPRKSKTTGNTTQFFQCILHFAFS